MRVAPWAVAIALTAALFIAGCGGSGGARYDDGSYDDYTEEADATEADPSDVDATSVEDTGDYVCTDDCSGHEAGFSWGQENDLTDASECSGNSQSFIEGCEAFVQARQDQAEQEARDAADARDEAAAERDYEY